MVRRVDKGSDEAILNELSRRILGAAFHIHTALGPGLLESAYEPCLEHELRRRGLLVERQKQLPLCYDDVLVDAGHRIDLLVEGTVLVEIEDPPRSPSDGSARPRRAFASLRLNAPFQAAAVPSTSDLAGGSRSCPSEPLRSPCQHRVGTSAAVI